MTLAIINSRACCGIQAPPITVEVDIANGMPSMSIVGLPETAIKESKHRVRSALQNSNFDVPAKRITVNLAPADLPKEGSRLDLPIALGILAASNQLPTAELGKYEFAGELALSGSLRPITGCLPIAIAARDADHSLIIPKQNTAEASLAKYQQIYCAEHLLEITQHFNLGDPLTAVTENCETMLGNDYDLDLADVSGQYTAKRALVIAAAGGHSLLMQGPPGTGKSMLAARLPTLLPLLTEQEAIETATIHSISGKPINPSAWRLRPFRAPHHSASTPALVGGGSTPQPGEISLAHNGVLFLDELPEYSRTVLEGLREPIESGHISISRASQKAEFPARFQLIAAMNPCPCGYQSHPKRRCECLPDQIKRYQRRISGPIMDRIDIKVEVGAVDFFELHQNLEHKQQQFERQETSVELRKQVISTRNKQLQRQGKYNALLSSFELSQLVPLTEQQQQILQQANDQFALSMRAYHRILRVARTIADLEGNEQITDEHLHEAISYRVGDAN